MTTISTVAGSKADETQSGPLDTVQMIQLAIRARPDDVWRALTDGSITPDYYVGFTADYDLTPGARYRYTAGGGDVIAGTVLEVEPGRRLATTFNGYWNSGVAALPESTVTFTPFGTIDADARRHDPVLCPPGPAGHPGGSRSGERLGVHPERPQDVAGNRIAHGAAGGLTVAHHPPGHLWQPRSPAAAPGPRIADRDAAGAILLIGSSGPEHHSEKGQHMQFMLMALEDPTDFDARGDDRAEDNWSAWSGYIRLITDGGVLVGAGGLHPPSTATTVRVRNGRRELQDGPYADTKEQLGGYFVIEAATLDVALAWAERCPCATTGSVEVRPLMPPPSP